jgi:hypothetical protein
MIANYGISYSSLLNIGISVLSMSKRHTNCVLISVNTRKPDAGNLERKGPILGEASLVFRLIINIQGSSDYSQRPHFLSIDRVHWEHMLHNISPSMAACGPAACRSTFTPQLFQEYHPMKSPSNATGTSEPWNVIANIAHDGTINALWMLSHVGSGYMRVIRCCMSHVKVQAGRLPFTAGWLAVCLLACLLARVPAPVILLSDSFTFDPSNSPDITPSSRKEHT